MSKLGMESFMMFMSELLDWCQANNIPYGGFGRGVYGSVIAFLLILQMSIRLCGILFFQDFAMKIELVLVI